MADTLSSGRLVLDFTNQRLYRDTSVTATVVDEVNDLYSDVQRRMDDADAMDDPIPMSAQTPTEYSVINAWFLDDETPKYLFNGAVQTNGYSSGSDHFVRQIQFDGSGAGSMFVASDIGKPLVGTTTTDSGTILAYDERTATDEGVVWVRPDDPTPGGDEFDNASEAYTTTGGTGAGNFSAASDTGEALYANVFTLGTLEANTRIYVYQDAVKAGSVTRIGPSSWPDSIGLNADGQIDVLLKVREAGTLVDDGVIVTFARQGGKLYDHFESDISAGGRNPVPLSTGTDLNDEIGHHNATWTGGSGATLLVGEVVDLDSDSEVAAVVAAVTSPGSATGDFDYYLIRSLTQFTTSDAVTAVTSTKTMTIGTVTDLTPVTDTGITFVFGAFDRDINNGNGLRPYSIDADPNNVSFSRVYRRGKYLTRRGSTTALGSGSGTVNGEAYRGAALQVEYNAQSGSWVEGEVVYDQTTGAFGTIVADHDDGATGDLILMDVRGTFGAGNTIGDAPTAPTDSATINGTPRTITTPKTAPLGTLAGGVYFGAPGLAFVLGNIASGEENSYQLTDDDGVLQVPPQQVSVAVTGTLAGDRVAVFRLTGVGGTIVKDEYDSHATNNSQGDTTLEMQTSISSEAPANDGWVRVEYDTDLEDRYHYASYAGAVLTLTSNADWTGNTETAGDTAGLTLTDTTTPATFIADGVLPGMMVRNTTDGSVGVVASVDSETVLTLERRLEGGTENDWDIGDGYEINRLVRAYDGSDTGYIPFLDEIDVAGVGTVSATIVYGTDIQVRVVARQGAVINPFTADNVIDSGGLSQPIVRTLDTIAT